MPTPVDSVMLAQRAAELAKRSIKTTSKAQGLRLAVSMLDLTTLEGPTLRAGCVRCVPVRSTRVRWR